MAIIPVILCGGSGSRLWPLSRETYPKQFLNITGEISLLQETLNRSHLVSPLSSPIIISNIQHRFLISEQIRSMAFLNATVLLEPMAKNTAPAIAAASFLALEKDPDALLLILPSDHLIENQQEFELMIQDATQIAMEGRLLTFGIKPTEPHSGYGYISLGEPISEEKQIFKIESFIEKPNLSKAKEYVEKDNFFWNSGMFLFRADVFLEELARYEGDTFNYAKLSVQNATRETDYIRLESEAFSHCTMNSIDYAVMEKTELSAILTTTNLGWSDIGSWSAVAKLTTQDSNGNNLIGDVLIEDVRNSYLSSEHRLIAAIGLENTIVIETADAILVAQKNKVEQVKQIVETLNLRKRQESITHRKVYRPWGSYESIDNGLRFQVKRIIVNPGASLSLQMHYHRAEHWIVVKGTAQVTKGDEVLLLTENQSTYIPLGTAHRLENPGKFPLELIEIQSGSYLGEDDIVRLEDKYGRITTE